MPQPMLKGDHLAINRQCDCAVRSNAKSRNDVRAILHSPVGVKGKTFAKRGDSLLQGNKLGIQGHRARSR